MGKDIKVVRYTDRDSRSMKIWFEETKDSFTEMSNEESEKFVREKYALIKKGGPDAKKAWRRLFDQFRLCVIPIAKEMSIKNLKLEDLVQEGCIGLARAIEMYDENMGAPFLPFAKHYIRKYVYQYAYKYQSPFTFSPDEMKRVKAFQKAERHLIQVLEREPMIEEVIDFMEASGIDVPNNMKAVIMSQQSTTSLNGPAYSDDDNQEELVDTILSSQNWKFDSSSFEETNIFGLLKRILDKNDFEVFNEWLNSEEKLFTDQYIAMSHGKDVLWVRRVIARCLQKIRTSPLSQEIVEQLAEKFG